MIDESNLIVVKKTYAKSEQAKTDLVSTRIMNENEDSQKMKLLWKKNHTYICDN